VEKGGVKRPFSSRRVAEPLGKAIAREVSGEWWKEAVSFEEEEVFHARGGWKKRLDKLTMRK